MPRREHECCDDPRCAEQCYHFNRASDPKFRFHKNGHVTITGLNRSDWERLQHSASFHRIQYEYDVKKSMTAGSLTEAEAAAMLELNTRIATLFDEIRAAYTRQWIAHLKADDENHGF